MTDSCPALQTCASAWGPQHSEEAGTCSHCAGLTGDACSGSRCVQPACLRQAKPCGWPVANNECGHAALWTTPSILAKSAEKLS